MSIASWVLCATVVLFATVAQSAEQTDRLQMLLDDLKSDSTPMNAWNAQSQILALGGGDIRLMRGMLIDALDSQDYQLRQYAACILRNPYASVGIGDREEWPLRMIEVLIEGLRDDDFIFHRHGEGNAAMALEALWDRKTTRAVELLRQELPGRNTQSRYLAAVLLARYFAGTAQPEVSRVLFENLADDRIPGNGVTAYAGLIWLGKENFSKVMENVELDDWQQAAFVQCAARRFGINWSPPKRFWEEWYETACQMRRLTEERICLIALYLCPKTDQYLQGREAPEQLARLRKESQEVHSANAREEWIRRKYAILEPADAPKWMLLGNAAGPLLSSRINWRENTK